MMHSMQVALIEAKSFVRVGRDGNPVNHVNTGRSCRKIKTENPQELGIWHFRDVPSEAIVKAKIGTGRTGWRWRKKGCCRRGSDWCH
jgi:hypothetical protein